MAPSSKRPGQGASKQPVKKPAKKAAKKRQAGPSRGVVIGAAVALAVLIGGGLLVLSQRSDTGSGKQAAAVATGDVAGKEEIATLLAGIPQKGTVLGFDEAPATLIEYGDLRCPSCRQWDTETAPKVIEQLVRTKKIKLDFRLWPITRDSTGTNVDAIKAAQAGLAAAAQDHFWPFALLFYKNQQDESKTYATAQFLTGLATAAGVPDLAKFNEQRTDPTLESQLQDNSVVAQAAGFQGTPSFMQQIGNGEPTPYKGDETDVAAIGKALAGG